MITLSGLADDGAADGAALGSGAARHRSVATSLSWL
jgi:hypothetical protein